MDEIDIWRAAQQMRRFYGLDAGIEAAQRADSFLDRGDVEAFEIWCRITSAISSLDRDVPLAGEATH